MTPQQLQKKIKQQISSDKKDSPKRFNKLLGELIYG